MTDVKCSEKHDTLYHYTSMEGFIGIMDTQSLWATHYLNLNDSSEFSRLAPILTKLLVPTAKQVVKDLLSKGDLAIKREIKKYGNCHAFVQRVVNDLVNAPFDGAFTPINGNNYPIFEPFITSFCSHIKDDEYIRKNGLLSMWRSYGDGGGVALVFKTAEIEDIIVQERERFGYSFLKIGVVVYETDRELFDSEFDTFIKDAKEILLQHLSGGSPNLVGYIRLYLDCVSRLKHQAFQEEREVRIVAMPTNVKGVSPKDLKINKIRLPDFKDKVKQKLPYLNLFDDGVSRLLPIQKIIVGPHRDQQERCEQIKRATKSLRNVEVTCSKTPYIEGIVTEQGDG
ncbi:MAG: DUF2971 domain-containing protein [Magnetovibrio sp.]|nr:DUF2971 domain-containing protein [Magnetovibrio sp.]